MKSVCNDRTIALKLKEEPVSILLVQVCLPSSKREDELEECSDITEDILVECGKGEIITILMRDWNSMVGDKSYQNNVGPHRLGRRNQTDQILIDFCEVNALVINNILFRKSNRILCTWNAPGCRNRYRTTYLCSIDSETV